MPEEITRILVNLLFCSVETPIRNLNVVINALQNNIKLADEKSHILEDLNLLPKVFLVATVDYISNTGNINLFSIVNAFCSEKANILFPLHPITENYRRHYGLWDKL
ncbi:hypothetical protein [Methanolobus sp. WCC5]|uniref:hypothetical protein n=1 Tax=Methanolobus sp. WCC5 TaxID=3125785 RepID=UPI00324F2F86